MTDWNPALYLKYERERTQPVFDLISRIDIKTPGRVLDIGCGPGNSTITLKNHFINAEVIGLDYSKAMIEKAKKDYPSINFIVGDANESLTYLGTFDIVFANASLQWLSGHESLIPRLFTMVNKGGIFAAQIPQFDKMPIAHVIENVANGQKWSSYFANFNTGMNFYDDEIYYDLLFKESSNITMWATEYYHIMDSRQNIMDMIKSTGLKPYLEVLPEELALEFYNEVYKNMETVYPKQLDGKVLFPFKRFFFIAKHQ